MHKISKQSNLTEIQGELELNLPISSQSEIQSKAVEIPSLNRSINYEIGEFWTNKQRKAAKIHEISYRACFKPQLARYFIDRYSIPGNVVYDPFMGRGTTLIEAALADRVPFGNDVNPLSVALTEPRLNPPSLISIQERLNTIPWDLFTDYETKELLVFYHPKTLAQIEGLRRYFLERKCDLVDKWIRMVAINRLTGHSTGFFSVYTLPPNQAVSIETQRKLNERHKRAPQKRELTCRILKKSRQLLQAPFPRAANAKLMTNQSTDTSEISSGSVDLTVTSPPFLDVVDYVKDNWLRCWFLGIDPATVQITQLKNISHWRNFVRETFVELERITRVGGTVAFEVGEVRGGTVKLEEQVIEAVDGLNFHVEKILVNSQNFTKTSNTWGVSNNSLGTNTNRIVLLKRF